MTIVWIVLGTLALVALTMHLATLVRRDGYGTHAPPVSHDHQRGPRPSVHGTPYF